MDNCLLYNLNNLYYETDQLADLIYADMIYENKDFRWVDNYWRMLKQTGVFIVQTDNSTIAEMKIYLDNIVDSNFINICIYKQEWGGVPKKGFPNKHDYILIYSKGKNFKWYGDRIQIAKKTAGTAFDKKGTGLKTPCSVFDDLGNFSTMDGERVKNNDGKNIQWQKPQKLMDRLCLPFTDERDLIIDPFMGSGSLGVWCMRNNRQYIGLELDKEVFEIAKRRIYYEKSNL